MVVRTHTRSIPIDPRDHTWPDDCVDMNTTQNIQRIIAAALIAASAGLVLSSCASRQLPEPAFERLTDSQIAEKRAGYLDLAERRAEMYRELAELRSDHIGETRRRYLDEHRGEVYVDQAERRAGMAGPVSGSSYHDLSERRLQVTGH